MSLDDMAVFVCIAERGSLTLAAHALGLPKSTVSRRLTELERRLGTALLHRTTRRIAMTEVGSMYFRQAKAIIAQAEQADRAVLEAREQPQGLLRVSASPFFGEAFLGPILATFLSRHPAVRVEVRLTYEEVDLLRDGFDIAIRVGTPPRSSGVVARRLGSSGIMYCAAPAYLERRGVPATPDELDRHECLVLVGPTTEWSFSKADGQPFQVRVDGRLTVNSITAVREAALAGLGIARVPVSAIRDDVQQRRLVPLLEPWTPPERMVFALYPRLSNPSPKVRAFVALLRGAFEAAAPWAEAAGR